MTRKTMTPAYRHYLNGCAKYSLFWVAGLWVAGGETLEPLSFSHSRESDEGKA